MSAKKGDLILLMPGATGWEVWKGTPAEGLSRHAETEHRKALEVTECPSGPLQMALPVRQLVALPFRAQTTDLDLLDDLAEMHLEKNGVRPSLDGGQLTDHFVYGQGGEDTVLTSVVLSAPKEGELPRRSPEAFDLSPRCLPLPAGKVAVWKELGRWVFGIGESTKALYFQCLPGEHLDARAGKDIRLAISQLQLQGLLPETPGEVVVWTTGSSADAREEELEALSRGVNLEVNPSPKPRPHWPMPPSKLLPEDVRAERMQAASKRNRTILLVAMAIAYLGVIAFLYTKVQKAEKDAQVAERQVSQLSGETTQLMSLQDKWEELSPVVEEEFYPYEVFHQVSTCLPNVGERKVRLTLVTVYNQPKVADGGVLEMNREIVVMGEAADTNDVAKFNLALQAKEELSDFDWTIEPESQTKTGAWGFRYTAKAPN
ncbi:MAG: hypothetical protein ACSHYF_02465 [Verrucomicrobiaceae bacterium]